MMLVLDLGLGLGLYVLKDLFKVLGLNDEVHGLGLGLVIKSLALGWCCQFVLEIIHHAYSQVTVSSQCLGK